jgi:hypothetical protein
MKKLFLSTTFLFAGVLSVLAQGLVDFSNAPWEAWPEPTPPNRLIYLGDTVSGGQAIANPLITAGLFENQGGNWVQLGDKLPFFGPGLEGIIAGDGIPRVLAVGPGVATSLMIKLYDVDGTEMILKDGVNTFPYGQGQSIPPSPTDTLMVNMRAFSVVPVPEPSTVALGVLGLGALLLFRRRK